MYVRDKYVRVWEDVIDLLCFTRCRLNWIDCIFTRCWRIFHWWVNSHIAWLWKTSTFTSRSALNLRQHLSAKDEKGTTFVYSFAQVPCFNFKSSLFIARSVAIPYFKRRKMNMPWVMISSPLIKPLIVLIFFI